MDDKAVREWARATGLPVGNRGRLPSAIVEAYIEAHPDDQWQPADRQARAACRCGRAWAGLAQAHCSTCHLHFSTVSNFDRHRPGSQCLAGWELELMGTLKPSYGPYGITWVGADERPADLNAGGTA